MKKLFIIYNIIFFTFGNVLLSNIHYAHHHHHDHHHAGEDLSLKECEDCIVYDNNKNFNSLHNELIIFNNIQFIFTLPNLEISDLEFIKKYSSRAPPILK